MSRCLLLQVESMLYSLLKNILWLPACQRFCYCYLVTLVNVTVGMKAQAWKRLLWIQEPPRLSCKGISARSTKFFLTFYDCVQTTACSGGQNHVCFTLSYVISASFSGYAILDTSLLHTAYMLHLQMAW